MVIKMRKYTTVTINPNVLKTLRKFASIHDWSFAQFCERLAITLTCGIDGLEEWELEDLKKTYPYSDVVIVEDIRTIFEPKEGKKDE